MVRVSCGTRNMKPKMIIVAVLAGLLGTASAQNVPWDQGFPVHVILQPAQENAKVIPSPAAAKAVAQAVDKEWTYLLYVNGHAGLDGHWSDMMGRLARVGSTTDLNVVAQWARPGQKTRRIYLLKDGKSELREELPPVNMGDYRKFVAFIRWGVKNFPAKHYLIQISAHGEGWSSPLADSGEKSIAISPDDLMGQGISLSELGLAMRDVSSIIGKKVDVFFADSCLMSMAEVMAEIDGAVEIFVGSEAPIPAIKALPYEEFLGQMADHPDVSGARLAKILVDTGREFGWGLTLSALDLARFHELQAAMANMANALRTVTPDHRKKMVVAAERSEHFKYAAYVDLLDFCDHLQEQDIPGLDQAVLQSIHEAMKKLMIAHVTTSRPHSHGLSVWVPTDSVSSGLFRDHYITTKFSKATRWWDAVEYLSSD